NPNPYTTFNLQDLNLLPTNWVEQIIEVVNKHAIHTELDGRSSTSREPEGVSKMSVYVVSGDSIKEHLNWLYNLYEHQLCELASQVAKQTMYPALDVKSSVNINVLKGQGARYEWHVDNNPMTGVLFVTSHLPGEGGELLFEVGSNRVAVNPQIGNFL